MTSLGMPIVCPPWPVGDILSPGRAQGFAFLGILNPAFVGTIHTCLLAVALVHVSSREVMGFEGLQSKVQLYRLDWAEGQTENMWVLVC